MGAQSKKKTFSFSLTTEEQASLMRLAKKGNFANRNEWLLAIIEASDALALTPELNADHRKVLRPCKEDQLNAMAAEPTAEESENYRAKKSPLGSPQYPARSKRKVS